MPFLPPNQQRQSTEGISNRHTVLCNLLQTRCRAKQQARVVGLLRAGDIDQKQAHSSNGATANAGSVMLTAKGRG